MNRSVVVAVLGFLVLSPLIAEAASSPARPRPSASAFSASPSVSPSVSPTISTSTVSSPVTTNRASIAATPRPGVVVVNKDEPVLDKIRRLSITPALLDRYWAEKSPPRKEVGSQGPSVVDRKAQSLRWHKVVNGINGLSALVSRADGLKQKLDALKTQSSQTAHAAGENDLVQMSEQQTRDRSELDREKKSLEALLAERDAVTDDLQRESSSSPRPSNRTQSASSMTTAEELADLLENAAMLRGAELAIIEGRVAESRKTLEILGETVAQTDTWLKARTRRGRVTQQEVSKTEKSHAAAVEAVQRQQDLARDALRRAELKEENANREQRAARTMAKGAASSGEREATDITTRVADRERQAAQKLRELSQLRADQGTSNLRKTQAALLLYRTLHGLEQGHLTRRELVGLLKNTSKELVELRNLGQLLSARTVRMSDERLAAAQAKAESARRVADSAALRQPKIAALLKQELKVIEEYQSLLDESSVGLLELSSAVNTALQELTTLEAALRLELDQENLFSRKATSYDLGSITTALSDLWSVIRSPGQIVRAIGAWIGRISSALSRNKDGAVFLPVLLSVIVALGALGLALFPIAKAIRYSGEKVGPSSEAVLRVVQVIIFWGIPIVPLITCRRTISECSTGFGMILAWLFPLAILHVVITFARSWVLIRQVPGSSQRDTLRRGTTLKRILIPKIVKTDLVEAEESLCRLFRWWMIVLVVLTAVFMPVRICMRMLLYNPELTSLLWLIYELCLVVVLARIVSTQVAVAWVRRAAGLQNAFSLILLMIARAVTILLVVTVPLLEAAGYAGLARFLVTRVAWTLPIVGVVWLLLAAIRELEESGREKRDGGVDDEEEPSRLQGRTLVDLIQSMLAVLVSCGTLVLVFRIWGGTSTEWNAILGLLNRGVSVVGLHLSPKAIIEASVTVWFSVWCSRVVILVLEQRVYPQTSLDTGLRYALTQTLHYCILGIGLMVAMDALGGGLEGLKWFAGAAGIGLGFGLQNIVQNFVSGLIVLYERPVRMGDIVEIGGVFGTIHRINVRCTVVRQPSQIDVIVPNSSLLSENVVNWTLDSKRVRLEVPVCVAYDTDLERANEILLEAAACHPDVLRRPGPKVLLERFGDSSLDLVLLAWVQDPVRSRDIKSELRMTLARMLQKAGIEIPFPQREVRLRRERPKGPKAPSPEDTAPSAGQ